MFHYTSTDDTLRIITEGRLRQFYIAARRESYSLQPGFGAWSYTSI